MVHNHRVVHWQFGRNYWVAVLHILHNPWAAVDQRSFVVVHIDLLADLGCHPVDRTFALAEVVVLNSFVDWVVEDRIRVVLVGLC